MAQLAIAAAGAAVGFAVGGPVGAQVGWAVGSMVGAQFGPKQKSQGPRLEDLRVTGSEYGQTIPWAAGHPRIAGQVWWASQRREISTTTSHGGKGGGGAGESTTYSYEVDILYGLLSRVAGVITRIWVDGKLVWTNLNTATDESLIASAQNDFFGRISFYSGEADQLPDPTYEAAVTNAPAYRGRTTVFIESMNLGTGGRIPNLTFEVAIETEPADDIVLRWQNVNITEVQFKDQFFNREGPAVITQVEEDVRVGVVDDVDDTIYRFSLQGEYLGTDTRTVDDIFPGPEGGSSSPATKPCGMIGGDPLRIAHSNRDSLPSAALILPIGTLNGGVGISGTDLADVLPGGEIVGVVSMGCNDSEHCVIYTAPHGSNLAAATIDKWYLVHWNGSTASIVRQGTLETNFSTSSIYYSRTGEAAVTGASALENDNLHVWRCTSSEVFMYRLDSDGVMRLKHSANSIKDGLTTAYSKSIHAKDGYCVVVGGWSSTTSRFESYRRSGDSIVEATLKDTVDELSTLAQTPAGSWDATALSAITKPVRAFPLSQVATTRSAIEQLMSAYFFESYVTDKIYFVPRAGSVLYTIDADDMGAGLESPEDETLPMQVLSDLEIPAQVSLSYSNVDADYTTATEHSDRLLSGQVSTSAVQLPLAFTSAEAKGIADAIVVDGYASRVTGTFSVPLAYAELTPTDVVAVPDADGNVYRVRIVRRTDEGPLLRFEWVLDDATAIESAGITSEDYTPTVGVALPGETVMEVLDIPLMRDAENTLGHYVAATSSGTTWPGASISRSLDDVEFSEAARVSERGILGVTTTTLGNYTGIGFDERNTVTVRLSYGTLSSSTRAGLLADASVNNIMIGAELVRFRTATFVSDGIYTLSGLLRGQKGTEWAMAGHTSSDVVVLIQTAGMRYVAIDLPSLSAERFYKGVTSGKSLASVSSESFTCEGVSLKPLAPVNVRRTVGTANQITVTWDRRTRLACTFTGASGISVPLGELTEAYEVDVVLIAGSVLKRTLTASSASAIYTAAMQTADGIGASTPIRFDVYQMSAVVGRGYVASLTTVGAVTPLPQITTLTVGGSFSSGAALYATLGGVTYNYTSVGGDTNLDGIATSFAAIIDAASAYSATSVGNQISVTGAQGIAFPVSVGVRSGDNSTRWAITQTASDASEAIAASVSFRYRCQPGANPAYPTGTVFGVVFQRIEYGVAPLSLVLNWLNDGNSPTNDSALQTIASAFMHSFEQNGWREAYGIDLVIEDLTTGLMRFFAPADDPNWQVVGSATNIGWGQVIRPPIDFLTYANQGAEATPPRPQIVTLTLAGTPVTGNVYRATLGGAPLDYTATGGDTTMALVATGLAGVIDAHADYIASAVGAVITITHASNNVAFTYSATVIASTVTLTAATTQEAA